jgi:hypothetical protein
MAETEGSDERKAALWELFELKLLSEAELHEELARLPEPHPDTADDAESPDQTAAE